MNSAIPHADPNASHNALQRADEQRALQHLTDIRFGPRTEQDDEDTIDLREYWGILVRRRWTVFLVVGLVVLMALLATFLSTPIYRGSLLLQIDREEGKVLEYQNLTPEDARNANDFYQTQYELLQSRSLARRVIDQLGLKLTDVDEGEGDSLFDGLKDGVKGLVVGLVGGGEQEDGVAVEPDLERAFLEQLTIEPVRNSRLVRIHYDSPDPREAAAVANAVADNFVNMNLERRFDASAYAKSFLQERLQQVRANLEDSEQRLIAYAREKAIVDLDDRLSILRQQLSEMSSELNEAQAARIAAEANYTELVQGGTFSSAQVLGSKVIGVLKERKAELDGEYQEGLKVYKPDYPKMQQIQRQIAEVERAIEQETQAIVGSIKGAYQAKIREEAQLTLRVQEIKEEILALQDRSTDYQTLKREVDTNRELYDGLLQRMKEIGVVAGIGTNNISIVDRARVPRQPFKPSLTKNLALALAIGLLGGVLLAFGLETLDDTIKVGEEVERRLGAPVLGVFPRLSERLVAEEGGRAIAVKAFHEPQGHIAEAARSLRTALIFSTAEGAPSVLHFTSAGSGEGKTTASTNTAVAFAQTGSKVLIIDADLRNPSLHRAFALGNDKGLTHLLAGDAKPAEVAQPTEVPRLFAITSGPLPPNPVELLSSAKMLDLLRLATERFDHVVIDGPPVIGLADALVLANLARASVFVVEPGATRKGALDNAVRRLNSANARILGAVLQKLGRSGSGYGYDYAYHYSYSYGTEGRAMAVSEQAAG